MRKTYLVTYDIREEGRLRKVHKCMRNWGDHLQYSVFECQLNATELTVC
jgi:CRISPR-associated protein Cas2